MQPSKLRELNPTLSKTNLSILQFIQEHRERNPHPRVGDFVRFLALGDNLRHNPDQDSNLRRIAHDWGDSVQMNNPRVQSGSVYIDVGYESFSGALDPGMPKQSLVSKGETIVGVFWMFDEGIAGAGRGVTAYLPCPVYEVAEDYEWLHWKPVDF